MKRAILALCLCLASGATRAEDLVAGLSQDVIQITSNYTGTDIVVFGAIERTDGSDPGKRDVVVVVRGPDVDMQVRRKVRIAGIWINRDAIGLGAMPAYYFIASTRPLAQIASPDTLQSYRLGLENIQPRSETTRKPAKAEPFRQAAIRDRAHAKLYAQSNQGVEFLSPTLFRVRVPVPANVAPGQYTAEVYLFRGGAMTSAQYAPLTVDQSGLERGLYSYAHESPLAYGVATVLMAAFLGWVTSVMFRRR